MKDVLYIGPFPPPLVGATVKNRVYADVLKNNKVCLTEFNTIDWKRYPIQTSLRFFREYFQASLVICSVSRSGRLFFLPFLCFKASIVSRFRYVLLPVGGAIAEEIVRLPYFLRFFYIFCLKKADQIFVETDFIKKQLNVLGVCNVQVLPNARISPEKTWVWVDKQIRKVIYISRIVPEKGVRECLAAADLLNKEKMQAHFYFYGPIDPEYEKEFLKEVSMRFRYVSYEGIVPSEQVNELMIKGDVFVLPSYREGLPGVLVEAMLAGVPLVVSNLPVFMEYLVHKKNAWTVEPRNVPQLVAGLQMIFENKEIANELSQNARKTAEKFDAQQVIVNFITALKKNGWLMEDNQ